MEKASVVFFGYDDDAIELPRLELLSHGHTITANALNFHDSYRLMQSVFIGQVTCDIMVLNSDLLDEVGRNWGARKIFSLYNDFYLRNDHIFDIPLISHPGQTDINNLSIGLLEAIAML